jgi:hypothetical protein
VNLVDTIQQQLSGEVTKKLSSMAGIGEADLQKLIGAGLPAMLSGLGSVASTKQGAGKIADAIGGMDSSLFGNLAGMLSGNAAKSGGNVLGSLFGGSLVDGLAATISKFTGINATLVKTGLGFLVPLVLGSVGSTLKGAKPDAASVSRLFSDQKQNIAASLPQGLSLDTVPGFRDLASAGAALSSAAKSIPASGGPGKLLVPILALALVAAAIYFWKGQETIEEGGKGFENTVSQAVDTSGKTAEEAVNEVKDAMSSAIPTIDAIKGQLGDYMSTLTGDLEKITDSASAEAALPVLNESVTKLDSLAATLQAVPQDARAAVLELIRGHLDKLNPILDTVSKIPGIGEPVTQVLNQLKSKLEQLAG